MGHDDDAPDVVYLGRAAVHAVRWGSFVEPVPVAYLAFTVLHSSKRSTTLSYRDTRPAIAAP